MKGCSLGKVWSLRWLWWKWNLIWLHILHYTHLPQSTILLISSHSLIPSSIQSCFVKISYTLLQQLNFCRLHNAFSTFQVSQSHNSPEPRIDYANDWHSHSGSIFAKNLRPKRSLDSGPESGTGNSIKVWIYFGMADFHPLSPWTVHRQSVFSTTLSFMFSYWLFSI